MCGISGYLGRKNAAPIVHESLRRLEYRGYDSVGIATVYGGRLFIKKDRGKISEVHERHNLDDLPGYVGIGHTRWATHGIPSKENAHPHTDCENTVAVVHNGIIENFMELRNILLERHKFVSRTDTEVIPHLVEENLHLGLKGAVQKTIKELRGSYAIAVISTKEPDKIVLAKNESPSVIGVGNDAIYFASDIPAFLPYLNNSNDCNGKVIRLNDGEVAELSYGGINIELDGKKVEPKVETIDLLPESIEKGDHLHFMLKEIEEQPLSLKRSLQPQKIHFDEAIRLLSQAEDDIFAVGAGTSYHVCLAGLYMFNDLAGKRTIPVRSSELEKQYGRSINEKNVVIAITQSGETADTLSAVKFVRKRSSKVISITNTLGSAITQKHYSDVYLIQNSGPEIGVAASKTFTSQLSIMLQLALEVSRNKNRISDSDYKMYHEKLHQIPRIVNCLVEERRDGVIDIVKKYKNRKSFGFLGRGINTPVAYEGRLKLMELNYLPCISYPAGESKHGPISVIEKGFPVVAVAPNDSTHSEMISSIQEMKAREASIIAIIEEGDEEIKNMADDFIEIPNGIPELLTPIPTSVILQMFAYYMCVENGLDPDKPRNLAKSVTVK